MVLNNRPITYFYTENNLIEPVTPNNLLLGRNLLYTSTEHFVATRICYRIREFSKIKNRRYNSVKLNINDVILIEDKNLKKMD